MYNLYKFIFLLGSMLLFHQLTFAQFVVSGTVVDGNRETELIGANIYHEESSTGTTTDVNGEFSIELPGESATLSVSYIGYISREIEVDINTSNIRIELFADIANLEEIVVTGLATSIKRSNLANAVTKIDATDIAQKVTPQTLDNALQGKIAGVNIRLQDGAPGGGNNVQMRGISTLGAGSSQPLYIIDGVYVNNDVITNGRYLTTGANDSEEDNAANRLADINPDDVESIEVLKGASAAAIYGARANAGVVIITTKSGEYGDTQVSFQQDLGFATPLNLLGTPEWDTEKIDFIDTNLGFQGTASVEEIRSMFNEADSNNEFFDYEDILYGNRGLVNETSINVSGGGSRTRFFVSGTLRDEDGIIENTGFSRKSIRGNLNHQVSDRIQVSSNSNYINTDNQRGFTGNQNGSGASLGYTLSATPNFVNLYPNEDGSYPNNPFFNDNPLAITTLSENDVTVDRFVQSVSTTAELYAEGSSTLEMSINGGLDLLSYNSTVWQPNQLQHQQASANPGDVVRTKDSNLSTNLQALMVFNTSLDNTSFATQIGAARFDKNQNRQLNRGQGLAFGQNNINQARIQQVLVQTEEKITDVGFFGQQEVNWDDKFIGTLGGRFDRSTLNTEQDRYYFYPKASLAVNVANFDFWNIPDFNQLKLRAAYGETGGLPNFGNTFRVINGFNIDGRLASTVSTRSTDPDLQPERAQELEFGADINFFDGRLGLESTYYIKNVQDLILDLPTGRSTGIAAIATNAADLENKGIELGLTAAPIQSSRFNWISNVLFWKNNSEITDLGIPAFTTGGFGSSLGNYLIQEGFSPTTIVGTPAVDDASLFTIYGDSEPDFQMSFNNSFNLFRNFDLNFLVHWKKGGDNINLSQLLTDVGGTSPDWNEEVEVEGFGTVPKGFSRLLIPAGEAYVQDATFVKLREAGLYYTLPSTAIENWFGTGVRRVRLGASGTDLYMWTPYDSYDPEVSVFGTQPVNSSVEVSPFPTSRRLMFHFQVDF